MRTARSLALVLVAATSILLAGCGDTADKNAYVEKNNEIQQEAVAALSGVTIGGDPKSAVADIQKASDSIEAAAKKLDKLDVPSDWQSHHDKLVKSLEDQGAALDRMATAAGKGDAKAIEAEYAKIKTYAASGESAIDAMNEG